MSLKFNGSGVPLTLGASIGVTATPITILLWVRPVYKGSPALPFIADVAGVGVPTFSLVAATNGTDYALTTGISGTSSNITKVIPGSPPWLPMLMTQNGTSGTFRMAVGDVGSSSSLYDRWVNFNTFVLGHEFTGDLAEIHVWTSVLSDSDYAALAGGALPETVSVGTYHDGWSLKDYAPGGTYLSIKGTRTLTATGGVSASSNGHPITRAAPGPTISAHPANQTVTTPATAAFSVTAAASGGGSLSYQWQRSTNGGSSWANVATGTGGTTSSYTTAATSVSGGNANNADQWRCAVTETGGTNAGTVNTNAATLTVNASSVKTELRRFFQRGNQNV